ncbi:MAG: hypothetical protein ACI8T1_001660, partial [Verrucomicrobiales bacterium]
TIFSGEALLEMRTQSQQGLPMNCPRELGSAFAVPHDFKVLPNEAPASRLKDSNNAADEPQKIPNWAWSTIGAP